MRCSIGILAAVLLFASPLKAHEPLRTHVRPLQVMLEAIADQDLGRLRSVMREPALTRFGTPEGLEELTRRVGGRDLVAEDVVYGHRDPRRPRERAIDLCVVERGFETAGCAMRLGLVCWRQARGGRHCRITGAKFSERLDP